MLVQAFSGTILCTGKLLYSPTSWAQIEPRKPRGSVLGFYPCSWNRVGGKNRTCLPTCVCPPHFPICFPSRLLTVSLCFGPCAKFTSWWWMGPFSPLQPHAPPVRALPYWQKGDQRVKRRRNIGALHFIHFIISKIRKDIYETFLS